MTVCTVTLIQYVGMYPSSESYCESHNLAANPYTASSKLMIQPYIFSGYDGWNSLSHKTSILRYLTCMMGRKQITTQITEHTGKYGTSKYTGPLSNTDFNYTWTV